MNQANLAPGGPQGNKGNKAMMDGLDLPEKRDGLARQDKGVLSESKEGPDSVVNLDHRERQELAYVLTLKL